MTPLSRFHGVHPVLQYPLDSNGDTDITTVRDEIRFVFDCGADGVTLAMVSEVTRLSVSQRMEFLSIVTEEAVGRGEVIFSVVAESSRQAAALAKDAELCGATALIVALPLTYSVPNAAQYGFFARVLDAAGLPVIIQDSSGYLGFPVSMDEQLRIYHTYPGRVMFKPEASPVAPMIGRLLRETNGEAILFDGTGGKNLIENFGRGVKGVLPGADMPWAITELWAALNSGEMDRAMDIQSLLAMVFVGMSSLDSYLAVEKFFLRVQGIFQNEALVPPGHYALDEMSRKHLLAILRRTADICNRDTSHWSQ